VVKAKCALFLLALNFAFGCASIPKEAKWRVPVDTPPGLEARVIADYEMQKLSYRNKEYWIGNSPASSEFVQQKLWGWQRGDLAEFVRNKRESGSIFDLVLSVVPVALGTVFLVYGLEGDTNTHYGSRVLSVPLFLAGAVLGFSYYSDLTPEGVIRIYNAKLQKELGVYELY
jgi:hypothetical protein